MKKIYTHWFDLFSSEWILFFKDYRYQADKYFQYDSVAWLEAISKDVFLMKKFWEAFHRIIPYLEGESESVVQCQEGIISCGFMNFHFQWFDKNGNLIQKREDIGFDSIYDFDLDKNHNICYVIPTHDYVWLFSLSENKELNLLKNLNESKYFSMPEAIKIYDDHLYISDMWNKRIVKISLKTLNPEVYMTFDEPISEFIQLPNQEEFAVLESWLYLL